MKSFLLAAFAVVSLTAGVTSTGAQEFVATLRGDVHLADDTVPPAIPAEVNSDIRQIRNYPEQPPLIPHKIEGYQIDSNANKCLTCHSRTAVGDSQAPMVSVTHFMNRDNQVLTSVSPRRYFCTQCHVSQNEAKLLVENDFVDVDSVLDYVTKNSGEAKE
ncbi:MAG: nitrate reductase cytochrome c-type subunit [Pseudoruegeria sp.]